MDDIIELVDQLVEVAQQEDLKHKKEAVAKGKGSQAIGDSFMLYHLKRLKEALEEEKNRELFK